MGPLLGTNLEECFINKCLVTEWGTLKLNSVDSFGVASLYPWNIFGKVDRTGYGY
jgi:hypothetical protein